MKSAHILTETPDTQYHYIMAGHILPDRMTNLVYAVLRYLCVQVCACLLISSVTSFHLAGARSCVDGRGG